MSLQAEMHSLVGQIAGASEMRRASLSSLHQGVAGQRESGRQFVHQSHQGHQRMARDLRSNLSRVRRGLGQGETQRKSGVQGLIGEIASDRGAARAEWRNMTGARHVEKTGGPAPTNGSDQGSGSPAQTSGKAAASGHRPRSRGKSA